MDNESQSNDLDVQALIPAYCLMAMIGGVVTGWLYQRHPELPIWKLDITALFAAGLTFVVTMLLLGVILAFIAGIRDESPIAATILRVGFHLLVPAYFGGAAVSLAIIVMSRGQDGCGLFVNQLGVGSIGLVILRAAEKSKTFRD